MRAPRVIERGPLSAEQRSRVLHATEALPYGDRICHGDFHAANIFMTDGGPVVIDCVAAHRGSPCADVAQTCVAIKDEVAAWKPIAAAVRLSSGHPPSSSEPLLRIIEDGLK
jgi:Ser/Thr protein kinase RdoA (MazF antagonist)